MSDILPDGWRWVKLSDVIRDVQTGFACGERAEDGIIQIRMNNVAANGDLAWQKVLRVPHDFTDMAKYYLNDGDILFNHTNSAELVGKSTVYRPSSEPVVFSNHFFRISPHEDVLDRAYLARWLFHCQRSGLFTQICNRWVGQAAVPKKKLLGLSMPLPSLVEQHRIIERLEDQLATTERARTAALAQLTAIEAMPQALLRQIFPRSPDARLSRVRRSVRLGDLCSIIIGRTPRRAEPRYWGGAHTWATISDMTASGDIVYETREALSDAGAAICGDRLLSAGTLMFSFKLSIGQIAFAGRDLYTNEAIAGIIPRDDREVDLRYLRHALSMVNYGELVGHAAKGKTLNRKTLALIEFPLPPLNEQRRIVARLEEQLATVEHARAAARAQLDSLDALPTVALRLAFTP